MRIFWGIIMFYEGEDIFLSFWGHFFRFIEVRKFFYIVSCEDGTFFESENMFCKLGMFLDLLLCNNIFGNILTNGDFFGKYLKVRTFLTVS